MNATNVSLCSQLIAIVFYDDILYKTIMFCFVFLLITTGQRDDVKCKIRLEFLSLQNSIGRKEARVNANRI